MSGLLIASFFSFSSSIVNLILENEDENNRP